MSNFTDDVDLVDDCAPMPGETKPTLKSNPSGTAFIPQKNTGQVRVGLTTPTDSKQKAKVKMAQQTTYGQRKNASSFMQQSYPRGYPTSGYPSGIPKSFLQEAQTTQGAQSGPVMSALFPRAGIPKTFLTAEHQQQIGQIPLHQQPIFPIYQQQQQQIFPTSQQQQQIGQRQQQNLQTPSQQQQKISQTSQQQKQIGQTLPSLMSIDTKGIFQPKTNTQMQSTKQPNTGFKQTFQPIETQQQQPQTSNINITLQESGAQENPPDTNDANKSQNQQFAEAQEDMNWVKIDSEKQDEEPACSTLNSANTTEAQGSENSEDKQQTRRSKRNKRRRNRPPKTQRSGQNFLSTPTSTAPKSTTKTAQQQITGPQQLPQQQTTIGHCLTALRQQQTAIGQQQTTEENEPRQAYSPSDIYNDSVNVGSEEEENNDDGDGSTPGSKRLSAFRRLGPVTQPKKPKMTINWLCNKDVRQVVESVEDEDVPVHLRKYLQMSTDDIVVRYLPRWPWISPPPVRRTLSARHSKSVMILEQEQMDEMYKKDSTFFQVSLTGYPDTWTKEDVLDTVLHSLKGHSFIPCFIEFSQSECKFLVIRSRTALLQFHKLGFVIKKDDVTLNVVISVITLNVNVLEFVPRLILMKRLSNSLTDTELDLKEFTLQKDVSHFIYFPLERQANQIELLKLQSTVEWKLLTKLDLSYNKLTNLNGFFLKISTPKLKHLDLSYNNLDKISCLFNCRDLPLKTIAMEGNPLCIDYIDKEHYVKVLKMLFTELVQIDGINILNLTGMPAIKQNYCTEEVQPIIGRLLEVYFPLLEASVGERLMIQDMYDDNAVLTITHMPRLRYSSIYLDFRSLFKYARIVEEDELLSIRGSSNIVKVLCKWPQMEHDPYTFTVDLMYHVDTTIIFRICGIFKLVSDSLAEDEPLLHFTRTLVLTSRDGVEYKISNEMVYWELPSKESVNSAFKSTSVWKRQLTLKFESAPDEELKENLVQIFMNLTQMARNPSQKCLELKNWDLRHALDYFINLLKLDNLDPIMK